MANEKKYTTRGNSGVVNGRAIHLKGVRVEHVYGADGSKDWFNPGNADERKKNFGKEAAIRTISGKNGEFKVASVAVNVINRTAMINAGVEEGAKVRTSANGDEIIDVKVEAYGVMAERLQKWGKVGYTIEVVGGLKVENGYATITAFEINPIFRNNSEDKKETTTKKAPKKAPAEEATTEEIPEDEDIFFDGIFPEM